MAVKKKQSTKSEVKKILEESAVTAVRVLSETLVSEVATVAQKIDCAKDILNRAYGKSSQEEEVCREIVVTLSKELKEYAK